jgi:hypothetical protein
MSSKQQRDQFYREQEKQLITCLQLLKDINICQQKHGLSHSECKPMISGMTHCASYVRDLTVQQTGQYRAILPAPVFGYFFEPKRYFRKVENLEEKRKQCFEDIDTFIKCIETRGYRKSDNKACQESRNRLVQCSQDVFCRFY